MNFEKSVRKFYPFLLVYPIFERLKERVLLPGS